MNPFIVSRTIKRAGEEDNRMTIDMLSAECGMHIRHFYVKMSKEMFVCDECGGFPRHWVKGLKLHSWITLWFYKPKNTVPLPQQPELEEAQDLETAVKNK